MPWIHNSCGEKGGVGKSIVSLALAEYFLRLGKAPLICEADRSNGDVGRAFEGKQRVIYPYFTEDSDQIDKADTLLDEVLASNTDAVVNSPAQSHRALVQWLSQGSADLAIEEGIKLCFWFVTSGEYDSVTLFLESLQEFDGIPHILIRNRHFTDRLTYDYSDPDVNESLGTALQAYKVPVIYLPRFGTADLDFLKAHSLTFGEAISRESGLTIAARSRVKRALTTFFSQLDALEVLTNGTSDSGAEPAPKTPQRKKRSRAKKSVGDSSKNGDS
ncbi:mobilization protein [Leptolyngbya sp. Heron Island J]|uniref:mobilization protein n=1 Tax=Leptolyngbya sp. Heron Island J TaxID=1385935 RepID=UPI0003B9B414|nr:mobilization protein [Leptolyngbya sp. Heron Island J]ESA36557.1 mobilization protein [Leptolyngbya sp. Heron Island J]